MKLILDFGNTLQKAVIYENERQIHFESFSNISIQNIKTLKEKFPALKSAILSSVINESAEISEYLRNNLYYVELTSKTPLPIINKYQTPESLGKDRLAAAVAANHMHPGKNVLVIDAGSCITYDLVNNKSEYLGGSISPGIDMRFRALNTFTGKLPLVSSRDIIPLTGQDTGTSVASGVLNGIVEEMKGIIDAYRTKYPGLMVILSGGDMKYFDKCLKNNIFAVSNIVIAGLNIILDFNLD